VFPERPQQQFVRVTVEDLNWDEISAANRNGQWDIMIALLPALKPAGAIHVDVGVRALDLAN
jgi:hypothetical protein